jgi:hypothetical protein
VAQVLVEECREVEPLGKEEVVVIDGADSPFIPRWLGLADWRCHAWLASVIGQLGGRQ